MLLYKARMHRVEGAATATDLCGNCGNVVPFELAYAKEGIGISVPIVSLFTDKATLAKKSYYLQCPICHAADRVSRDAAQGMAQGG